MGLRGLSILGVAVICVASVEAQIRDSAAPPGIEPPGTYRTEVTSPVRPTPSGDLRATLVPVVREYQWAFHVPVASLEHRRVAVAIPVADTHSTRWSYDVPDLRSRHFKLWDFPEFSCKYPDLTLPNTCQTVWHGVYADLPVLVSARDQVDVDVPRVRMGTTLIDVYIPRYTWTEKIFRFSLPAWAPQASVDQVRLALNAQRADVTLTADETIASLERQIERLRAMGQDPARLESGDGSWIDLMAQRQTLLDERAQELERLAGIDTELSALAVH
jgi:hypothetical protein